MVFKPTGNIYQVRKAKSMAFGKTVTAETFQLFENTFGVFFFVTTGRHAVYQFIMVSAYQSFCFKSCHTAA